ncbi:hypothetical protein IH992_15980 [Candidatus Poribacteria bacterium]|nr:hypothetical protein [Candidatus Poribacteria bacterium]
MKHFGAVPPEDTLHDDSSDKLEETYNVALEMSGNIREYQEKAHALMEPILNRVTTIAKGCKGRVSDETEQSLLELALFLEELTGVQMKFALADGRVLAKLGRTRGIDSMELDKTLDRLEHRDTKNDKQLPSIQPQEEIIC